MPRCHNLIASCLFFFIVFTYPLFPLVAAAKEVGINISASGSSPTVVGANHLSSDIRYWDDAWGIAYTNSTFYIFSSGHFDRIKLMKKFTADKYWGVGYATNSYQTTSGGYGGDSTPVNFDEVQLLTLIGIEEYIFVNFLKYYLEVGYIFSRIDNFSGIEPEKPSSRAFLELGLGINFKF